MVQPVKRNTPLKMIQLLKMIQPVKMNYLLKMIQPLSQPVEMIQLVGVI